MALNIFINKLREPMGSHVRSMQPATLIDARVICMREQSLSGLRYSNRPPMIPNSKPPIPIRNYYNNTPQRYQAYIPQTYRPPQNSFNTRPPFMQNNSKGPNPYYNHRPFAPTNAKPIMAKPHEPMDTSSITNKYKQPTYGQYQSKPAFMNRFQPSGPPRFVSTELHCNEYEENQYSQYPAQYEYQDESQDNHQSYEQHNQETILGEDSYEETPIIEIEEDLDFQSGKQKMPDT